MSIFSTFWRWYGKHERVHTGIAALVFSWQLVHLFWLAAHVIALRVTGVSLFPVGDFWQGLIILVDYTEIPAIVLVSLTYINEIRKRGASFKSILFLFLLNIQWLHLFWITDEFVVGEFFNLHTHTILPSWLAWIALLIDYLEFPVMIDTFRKFFRSLKAGRKAQV